MKPLEEWGIDLQPMNNKLWKRLNHSVFWKLVLVNGFVIGIAIWLAGVSVTEFACLLVKQYSFIGEEESALFNKTMDSYLLNASILAVLVAGLVHYFIVKKLLAPLKTLSLATKMMAKGKYPALLPIDTMDEIGKLTADFNHLSQKMKQAEELRKKIMSDIAHELRTPLTNINGYLEALSTGMIEGDPELYSSLHEESLRIIRLVQQMHELNVWESKKITQQDLSSIQIEQVIRTCVDSFALELENKEIVIEVQAETATVEGDRDGLKQVIFNLLDNVLHYDLGGWVNIQGKAAGGMYQVSVTNNGQPIPPEQSDRIFDRFYRLDPSRNRETGGSGLGLALVKEIVEQHHGEVGLSLNDDIYTFWFKLPIKSS